MRVAFLAAILALPASAASAPAVNAPAGDMPVFEAGPSADDESCPPISRYHIARRKAGRDAPLEARKLAELPVADMYMAVDRRIGGCNVPIIARYGIGGSNGSR